MDFVLHWNYGNTWTVTKKKYNASFDSFALAFEKKEQKMEGNIYT